MTGGTVLLSMKGLHYLTKKEFITDEEIGMGGSIQKLVCAYINISGSERARSFWEE
jgi:hypothetical protein